MRSHAFSAREQACLAMVGMLLAGPVTALPVVAYYGNFNNQNAAPATVVQTFAPINFVDGPHNAASANFGCC